MTDKMALKLTQIIVKALSAHAATVSNCPKDVRNLHFNAVDAEIQELMVEQAEDDEARSRFIKSRQELQARLNSACMKGFVKDYTPKKGVTK